jgi:hypothetical protein
LASSILSSVWVLNLCFLSSLGHILHSISLPSTIATITLGVAINNLLLWETHKRSSSEEVGALNGRSCRESPARSALTLVLNWVYCSFISPVDWSWNGSVWVNVFEPIESISWELLWSFVT